MRFWTLSKLPISKLKMSDKGKKVYDQLIPEIEDWPIYLLHQEREQFVKAINAFTLERMMQKPLDQIRDNIASTVYLERIRIKEEPWKVDPPNEKQFWNKIRRELLAIPQSGDQELIRSNLEVLLTKIVNRYSEEIVGTFKKSTFLFARKFLTVFFNRLLNTAAGRNFSRIFSVKHRIYDRLDVQGELDTIRALFSKGTVVLVPTHFSNLDSILLGYALDAVVGLPSFLYGAGLNLYNTGYTAYFMNRMGAYRLDRRKKNPIYLTTLKAMSKLSIERGTNSLFFPGGTRTRSGHLEDKLKMGLLGTAVEAQRSLCERGSSQKIFIVPLVMSYHFVLEAGYLIEQHLKRTGKEQYLDFSYSRRKILRFVWKLFSQSSTITLSLDRPMDVLGNPVDSKGISYDQFGNPIDIAHYFTGDSVIQANLQREAEYTKILAGKIAHRYREANIVISSHIVAYAAFRLLRAVYNDLDIYGVLRQPTEQFQIKRSAFVEVIRELVEVLKVLELKGKVKLHGRVHGDVSVLIDHGVKNLGAFHAFKPLTYSRDKDYLFAQDYKLLFYYHNRMDAYGLDKKLDWQSFVHRKAELKEVVAD